jgi:5-methylcytosine-specific restriction endonuclease McrA
VSRTQTAGRVGRPWREVSARVYREETHCWLCGEWVDQTLPPKHPYARSADHLHQLQHGGPPILRSNLKLAHIRCNTARSNALRYLSREECACSLGLPCAALKPRSRGAALTVDATAV